MIFEPQTNLVSRVPATHLEIKSIDSPSTGIDVGKISKDAKSFPVKSWTQHPFPYSPRGDAEIFHRI